MRHVTHCKGGVLFSLSLHRTLTLTLTHYKGGFLFSLCLHRTLTLTLFLKHSINHSTSHHYLSISLCVSHLSILVQRPTYMISPSYLCLSQTQTLILMHSCSHALMLSCTYALMHSCSHALMLSCSHALMLSCTHALMHSCSYALMHSCSHALMFVGTSHHMTSF